MTQQAYDWEGQVVAKLDLDSDAETGRTATTGMWSIKVSCRRFSLWPARLDRTQRRQIDIPIPTADTRVENFLASQCAEICTFVIS